MQLPAKRNKWLSNEAWKNDQALREIAKSNNEMFYYPVQSCKNNHNKRYVNNNACVECAAIVKLNIKNTNPLHSKAQKKKHHLKFMYGISVQEYNNLLEKQDNKCAICRKPETAKYKNTDKIKTLAVDHCKETKKIRGLLCLNCNMGIGKLFHNPELLRKAALYCEGNLNGA